MYVCVFVCVRVFFFFSFLSSSGGLEKKETQILPTCVNIFGDEALHIHKSPRVKTTPAELRPIATARRVTVYPLDQLLVSAASCHETEVRSIATARRVTVYPLDQLWVLDASCHERTVKVFLFCYCPDGKIVPGSGLRCLPPRPRTLTPNVSPTRGAFYDRCTRSTFPLKWFRNDGAFRTAVLFRGLLGKNYLEFDWVVPKTGLKF